MPLEGSVSALGKHIAHLQEDEGWVVLITTRLSAASLRQDLQGVNWNRLVFIDTVAPVHAPPAPGPRIEYVPGAHLLELVHLRERQVMARLPKTPHVVYYDAFSLSSAVPREALEEMTREWAAVTPEQAWTDLVVHDEPALPAWQEALYRDLMADGCPDCVMPRILQASV